MENNLGHSGPASDERRNDRVRRGNQLLDQPAFPAQDTEHTTRRTTKNNSSNPSYTPPVYQPDESQPGPVGTLPTVDEQIRTNPTRQRWSMDEYVEIIWCCYYTLETTGTDNLKSVFNLWRSRNPDSRPNLTPNTLGSQKRYIINHNKIPQEQLDRILQNVKAEVAISRQSERNAVQELELDHQNHQQMEVENPSVQTVRSESLQANNQPTVPVEFEEEQRQHAGLTPSEEIAQLINKIKERELADENTNRKPLLKIPYNHQTRQVMAKINEALKIILDERTAESEVVNVSKLNVLIYSAAEVATSVLGLKHRENNERKVKTTPRWKTRIERKIRALRKDLSQIMETTKDMISSKVRNIKKRLYKFYKIDNKEDLERVIEELKQKIQAKAQRIRRYEERQQFYLQNKQFNENPKKFYQSLEKSIEVKTSPNIAELQEFWGNLWENEEEHNENAEWIHKEESRLEAVQEMDHEAITMREVKDTLKKAANWKAPGPDGIQNYWLKYLTCIHIHLAEAYNQILKHPEHTPQWLTEGLTYLIPKNERTQEAKNYRPITCLPTMYKNLTSIISNRIYKHLERNNLYPDEQKGCARNTYGCKDHLLINNMITKNARLRKKGLSMAWIDYQKAFDSVPHTWLVKSMKINKVNKIIVNFLEVVMKKWKVNLKLHTNEALLDAGIINIRRGIFQGDSLSPLLFCMSLFPLSRELNEEGKGYQVDKDKNPINHLFYVDDLKLFTTNNKDMDKLLTTVKTFSEDVKMKLGLEKCARVTTEKGKIKRKDHTQIKDDNTAIKELNGSELYKYLGMEESEEVDHKAMKTKIMQQYYKRVRKILQSQLTGRNKFTAITTIAVPVLTYSFGILTWTMAEIQAIDRKTRKLLTLNNLHNPNADVDRLYIPRVRGGRGLTNIEQTYKLSIIGLGEYIERKEDTLMTQLREYEKTRDSDRTILKRKEEYKRQCITESENNHREINEKPMLEEIRKIKTKCKQRMTEQREEKWLEKKMHGQYGKIMKSDHINREQTYKWLTQGRLKGETEGLIIAAQDQAITTNYIKRRIHKLQVDSKCRLCNQFDETIWHITSGCPILAKHEYLNRHNKVAQNLHHNICQHYGIEVKDKWYEHTPNAVEKNPDGNIVVLWDQQIQTDRTINANKPDIVIKDLTKKECFIIDVAIPNDSNLIEKESEKKLKYKDLLIEIQRMWGLKAQVVPVIVGTMGATSKNLEEYLGKIPGKKDQSFTDAIQRTILLSTAHIIRKSI
ncbi:hypothetical protein M8J77_023892 [Diaphorina citri]|nr:hypothetical protein M8J77_023892 [Diaphorina citri]